MKGKIITLLLMLCFITGCDANYKLEYINGKFNEKLEIINFSNIKDEVINVYNFDLSTNYLDISDYSKEEGLKQGYKYYNKKLEDNALIYEYEFLDMDYANSQIARTLYPKMSVLKDELNSNKISDIYLRYPELDNITIEFKTDKFVSYHNADDKINDAYYWYINKNNYERKEIKISFSEEDSRDFVEVLKEEAKDLDNNDYDNLFKYTFIILGLVSLVIIIFVFIKVKTSNKK